MQKYSQNNHHQTNTKKKRRNPTKKNQTATKRNRGTPKKQQKAIKKGYENPSKNIRVVLWNETHRFEKPTPVVLGIIKNIMLLNINEVMANSTYVGVAESHKGVKRVVQSHIFETTVRDIKAYIIVREYDWGDFVLHSIYDAQDFIKHVKRNSERSNTSGDATRRWTPNAISCRKSTHKIRTTKQNQEKVESNHKKWKNKQKGNKNERKTEAKRTKVPTQTPERSKSELRTQSSEQKKRGVPPQIIYASFREMKPIVLKNQPPSFWGL